MAQDINTTDNGDNLTRRNTVICDLLGIGTFGKGHVDSCAAGVPPDPETNCSDKRREEALLNRIVPTRVETATSRTVYCNLSYLLHNPASTEDRAD